MESLGYTIWGLAASGLPWHRNKIPNKNDETLQEDMLREKDKFWAGNDSFKVKEFISIYPKNTNIRTTTF